MNERPLVVKQGKRKLTEAEKADIREHMREFEERYAAQTTDEGRAQVVAEAQEHRKWLAQELGVSVPQIGGVSAYKFKGDGGLELRPFADPQTGVAESRMPVQSDSPPIVLRESAPLPQDEPGASPKIEAMYDNPTKRAWRMAIRNAIVENFTPEYLRTARVVCLPGQALQEVTDVYLPLGIRPENIICLERNKDFANTMRANAQKLELAVEIRNESVEEFLKSEHPPISIASFDFLGPLHQGFFLELHKLRKAQKFAIVTNFQQRRERTGPRLALQANALLVRDVRSKQPPAITSLIRGSQLREFSGTKGAVDYLDQAYEGESAPALAEARDDGMYKLLEGFAGQRVDEVADNLYAEVGESPPHFSDMAALKQFVNGGAMAVTRMIEEVVAQNPRLEKKLRGNSYNSRIPESAGFSHFSLR